MFDQILNLPLLQRAWMFAACKHNGQKYPGSDLPYLVHIGNVLLALLPALEENINKIGFKHELALCCALLHDTLEDTDTSLEEIVEIFDDAIMAGVSALSKDKTLKEPMQDSLVRIQAQPQEIWIVKLADRIANLHIPPPHWNREKCLSYAEEAQIILDTLGSASPILSCKLASYITAWTSGNYSEQG